MSRDQLTPNCSASSGIGLPLAARIRFWWIMLRCLENSVRCEESLRTGVSSNHQESFSLASEEKSVKGDRLSQRHSDNRLDENLSGCSRVAADCLNGFRTDPGHSKS